MDLRDETYLSTIPEDSSESPPSGTLELPLEKIEDERKSNLSTDAVFRAHGRGAASVLSDGAVLADDTDIQAKQEMPKQKRKKRRSLRCKVSVIAAIVFLAAIVVAVTIVSLQDDNNNNNSEPDNSSTKGNKGFSTLQPSAMGTSVVLAPTQAPNTDQSLVPSPTIAPTLDPELVQELDAVLSEIVVNSSVFSNSESPQSKARYWILNEDLLRDDALASTGYERVIQRFVLALLYFAMGGDRWALTTAFLDTFTSECDWNGITCDDTDSIIYLNLGNSSLVGSIPEEMRNLTNLQEIYLNQNSITGEIPLTLFNEMQGLYWLDLSENSFEGTIPQQLWTLPLLRWVYLFDNEFSGTIQRPSAFQESENTTFWFQDVRLHNNNLTGSIPQWWTNLTRLSIFTASGNQLTGRLPEPTPLNLTVLDLSGNSITGRVPASLFRSGSQLTDLYLDGNKLNESLPEENMDVLQPFIENVYLQSNQIPGTIPASFGLYWPNISELLLDDNDFWNATLGPSNSEACTSTWSSLKNLTADCKNASDVLCSCCTICY